MKLKTTAVSYSFESDFENGFQYKVTAHLDSEWGWAGSVQFQTFGESTRRKSIEGLKDAVQHFLKELENLEIEEDGAQ